MARDGGSQRLFLGFGVSRTPSPSKRPRDRFCGGVYFIFWLEECGIHPGASKVCEHFGDDFDGGFQLPRLKWWYDGYRGKHRPMVPEISHIKFWISSPKIMKTNSVCGISMLCRISTFSSCGFQVPTFNMDLGMSLVPIKRLLSAWLLHLWRAKQVNTQCEKKSAWDQLCWFCEPHFYIGQIPLNPINHHKIPLKIHDFSILTFFFFAMAT